MILILVAIAPLLLIGLEFYLARGRSGEIHGYALGDTLANIAVFLGHLPMRGVAFGIGTFVLYRLWATAPFKFPDVWWAYVGAIVVFDGFYYFLHRVHHEVQFFWAAHEAHHSSSHYNFSTGLRLGWWTPFTSVLFFSPMALLGFSHMMILFAVATNLVYQFFLHTELVGRLGLLEWVFNTPSHHRVHHGSDGRYVGRNLGGILIVWDRLFGTFAREIETPIYGLPERLPTNNPLSIGLREGWRTFVDFWRAKGLRNRWKVLGDRPVGALRVPRN